jgi:hypothetical protein
VPAPSEARETCLMAELHFEIRSKAMCDSQSAILGFTAC